MAGKRAALISVHHAVMAVYHLKLREPQQVAWMVDALGSALAGHLAVQEGRQAP